MSGDTPRTREALETGRLDHIERSILPWRRVALTECGLPVEGHPVISRDAFVARVKSLGKERTAFTVCMTCWHTAGRHETWEQSPQAVMNRHTYTWVHSDPTPDQRLMDAELRAIEALIEAHREEFDSYVTGLGDVGDLKARRIRGERWPT